MTEPTPEAKATQGRINELFANMQRGPDIDTTYLMGFSDLGNEVDPPAPKPPVVGHLTSPIDIWWESERGEHGYFSWQNWAREAKVTLELRDVPRETMELIWGGPLPEAEPADDFVPTLALLGGLAVGAVALFALTRRLLRRGR